MSKINTNQTSSERRSFLTRFNAGAASLAALALGATAMAQTKPTTPFVPMRHDKDDWMDQVPGKHRMVFDTTSSQGFSDALLFATNFMTANRTDYGLQNSDIAIIVVARHISTGFGFSDAMWEKYGEPLATASGLTAASKTNPRSAGGFGLDALTKAGAQVAICAMATRRIAGVLAQATKGNADTINTELTSNLVPNGRMVAAGILAVGRAQERGYTLVTP